MCFDGLQGRPRFEDYGLEERLFVAVSLLAVDATDFGRK